VELTEGRRRSAACVRLARSIRISCEGRPEGGTIVRATGSRRSRRAFQEVIR
jgi:hypothetical protein